MSSAQAVAASAANPNKYWPDGLDMYHPHFAPGRAVEVATAQKGKPDFYGTADRFPPVTVYNQAQENEHRARGYIVSGEEPSEMNFQEYPLWVKNGEDERLAKSESEEQLLTEQGYERKGSSDSAAFHAAAANPHVPGAETQQYPRYVGKLLQQDPDAAEKAYLMREYPKWVGGKIVKSPEEEHERRNAMQAEAMGNNSGELPPSNSNAKPAEPAAAAPTPAPAPVVVQRKAK